LYTEPVKRLFLVFLLLATIALAGCHNGQKAGTPGSAGINFKVYHLRGKVVSTDTAKGEVTLNHEAIPGLMEAMTMPYKLKDPGSVGQLHTGDAITADLLVSPDPDADMLLDHVVVVAQPKPIGRPDGTPVHP
jgi:protein SCO1/2